VSTPPHDLTLSRQSHFSLVEVDDDPEIDPDSGPHTRETLQVPFGDVPLAAEPDAAPAPKKTKKETR